MIHPFSPPLQALTAAFQDKISVGHPTAPFDIPPILLLMWAPKGAQSHRGVIGRRESARQASGKHSPSARVAFPAALLSSLDRMTHSYQSWRESITHSLARSLAHPPSSPPLLGLGRPGPFRAASFVPLHLRFSDKRYSRPYLGS